MNHSESIKNIAAALLKAQKSIDSAKKNAQNPFFKSSYADLSEVTETIKKPLNDVGIVFLQPIDGEFVETVLIHAETGEWVNSKVQIVNSKPSDPQAQGSAITYARRYGLLAILSVPTEDDDGEAALDRQKQPSARPRTQMESRLTEVQRAKIFVLLKEKGIDYETALKPRLGKGVSELTAKEASSLIEKLSR